ncbi:DUF2917 domain-containing protein [Polaromonas sp. YR568]|uniref:DUF2917 domain-containing protein n=1 Tax=Polaromonas sp. YR568 TaxID=1855301 RepID=UPI001587D192|nr:DUF2917 domain-containing protein [Polaromonas sp. YR568]
MKTNSKLYGGTRLIGPGQALRLPRAGGELTVLRGRLWLTRNNDLGDHFIEAGQRVWLDAGENAVVEPAGRQGASLHWEPCRQGFFLFVFARPLNGTAFLALLAARGFMALGRAAAAAARHARGHREVSDSYAVFVALERGGMARTAPVKSQLR